MNAPQPDITPPTFLNNAEIWFSAYAFGWGYRAFALPVETATRRLAAADASPKQLLLAFQLGKRQIMQALENTCVSSSGDRVTLTLPAQA